jgi:hypothetical protein
MGKEWLLNARRDMQSNHHYPLADGVVNNNVLYGFALIDLEPKSDVLGYSYCRYLLLKNDNSIALLDSNLEEITSTSIAYIRFTDEVAIEAKVANGKFYFRTNYGAYYSKTFAYTTTSMMLSSKTTSLGYGVDAIDGGVVSYKRILDSDFTIGVGAEREVRYISSEKIEPVAMASQTPPYEGDSSIKVLKLGREDAPIVLDTTTAVFAVSAFFKNRSSYKKAWGGWAGVGALGKTVDVSKHPWKAELPLNRSRQVSSLSRTIKAKEKRKISISFSSGENTVTNIDVQESDNEIKNKLLFGNVKNALLVNFGGDGTENIAEVRPLQDVGNVFIKAPVVIDVEPIPAS